MILTIKGLIGSHTKASRIGSHLAAVLVAAVALVVGFMPEAGAAEQIVPWQLGLQPPNSQVMQHIHEFANLTFWIVGLITLFVMALLIIVMVRFNAKANPVPSKVSHNTAIEVVWTIVPVLILVIIAVPSLRLLYEELEIPQADVTVKAIGKASWAWTYEYPEIVDAKKEPIQIDSTILDDAQRTDPKNQPRLLAVDNNLVVPVGKVVRVLVTAEAVSVIHAFAVPAFGIKVDAMPGRLNETWFKADRVGMYYGQCSELCGRNHAYMPIAVQVVTEAQYKAWAEAAKTDVDGAYKKLADAVKSDDQKVAVAAR